MLAIFKAFFEEGKEVERLVSAYTDSWVTLDSDYIYFDFVNQTYRIKTQPTYIPFTWEDRDLFRDKWIRLKTAQNEHRINFIGQDDTVSCANWKEKESLISLFESHEFIDKTPFGKLKP